MFGHVVTVNASLKDASSIGFIQSQTWLVNYPNLEVGITREDIEEKVKEWNNGGDERIKRLIKRPNAYTLVAKKDEKVVGFVSALKEEDENIIESMHILPEFQRQGIGTKLLKSALDWLGNEKRIVIDVVSYNKNAQRLYERFGFIVIEGKKSEDIVLLNGKRITKILMAKD